MSMHLVGPYLTTTRYNGKKKKSNNRRLAEATAKHEEWLRKQGLHPEQRKLKKASVGGDVKHDLPDYRVDNPYQLSNGIGNGYKRGVMANLHKEKPEVQKAILDKASRTAPLYNKGGYGYVTDDMDPATLGSKSRRG